MRAHIALAVFVAMGCDGTSPQLTEIAIGNIALQLAVPSEARREEASDRAALRTEDGLTISAQVIQESRVTATNAPTARDVAAALVERVELGEQVGELAHHTCSAGNTPVECISGWIEHNGVRYSRDGFVVAAEGTIIWIDVSGIESDSSRVHGHADRVREHFGLRRPSGS